MVSESALVVATQQGNVFSTNIMIVMHNLLLHHPPYGPHDPLYGPLGAEHAVKREIQPVTLDLAAVAVVTFAGYLIARWLNLFDSLVDWLYAQKPLELQDLLGAVLIVPIALAIFSLRRWLELRRALREREAAEVRVADAARLEGVLLAARTMQHEMNNQLGMTVGYAELLADDPSLSAEQREMARSALHGAEQAAALLDRLRSITRIDVQHVGAPDGPVLELAACSGTGQSADRR
jgi:signal transduction histidine kinase